VYCGCRHHLTFRPCESLVGISYPKLKRAWFTRQGKYQALAEITEPCGTEYTQRLATLAVQIQGMNERHQIANVVGMSMSYKHCVKTRHLLTGAQQLMNRSVATVNQSSGPADP
jgi:hypothetical protein